MRMRSTFKICPVLWHTPAANPKATPVATVKLPDGRVIHTSARSFALASAAAAAPIHKMPVASIGSHRRLFQTGTGAEAAAQFAQFVKAVR